MSVLFARATLKRMEREPVRVVVMPVLYFREECDYPCVSVTKYRVEYEHTVEIGMALEAVVEFENWPAWARA